MTSKLLNLFARFLPALLLPLAAATPVGDPLGKLLADDGSSGDWFGSVAVAGPLAVVGAAGDGVNESGSAYLFDVTTQQQLAKLLPSDGAAQDRFGSRVALGPSFAVVGASFHDDNGSNSGAVWVFDTNSGQQMFELLADDGAELDHFGWSVAVSGTTIVVGAAADDDGAQGAGAVYLFDGTTGAQSNKLTVQSPGAADRLGESIATSGSLAIVGATGDDDAAPNAGAAYLFDLTTGQEVGKLVAAEGEQDDDFGAAVALDGTLALVGAWRHGAFGTERGAAWLFDAATGNQLAMLSPVDLDSFDRFGIAVALRGDRAVVGAAYDDDRGTEAGAAYVYDVSDPTQPVLLTKLLPDAGDPLGFFGSQVAIENDTVFVGAPGDDDNGPSSGSVYLFALPRPIGASYCGPAIPNSSGASGIVSAFGSLVATENCVILAGTDLAVGQFALFLTSMTQGFNNPPGSQGNLCLGGGIGRYKDDLLQTGAAGRVELQLDLENTPTPNGLVAVQPGETWNFQLWFRDKNPNPTSNFTDAVALTFQ